MKERRLRGLLDEYIHLLEVSETLGETVSEDGEIIKDIMHEHPEYADFLHGEEIETEDGTIMNPRLHIAVEAIIQRQLAKADPPEVRDAYQKLIDDGLDPHEARHAIGRILIETIWLIQHNKLSTEPNHYYRNQLAELKRQKLRHKAFSAEGNR